MLRIIMNDTNNLGSKNEEEIYKIKIIDELEKSRINNS